MNWLIWIFSPIKLRYFHKRTHYFCRFTEYFWFIEHFKVARIKQEFSGRHKILKISNAADFFAQSQILRFIFYSEIAHAYPYEVKNWCVGVIF